VSVGHFLAGIAALVWQPQSQKYLLLRRAGSKDFGAGSWDCVTGRVDQGESFAEAFFREVQEELGVAATIEFFISTTHFYRGTPSPENELLGIVCCCTLAEPGAIQISAEHDDFKWLTAVEIAEFLPANHWLHPVIARAELMHRDLPESIKYDFRKNGLDSLNGL
jgi:8-oxo-dGTP diphosphatase